MLTLTTWNVNGVRARQAQVLEWIERERPDVVCLQEVKASPEQIPEELSEISGYHSYWHGGKGYSGVALHLSRVTFPSRPAFEHPAFDHEHRIVVTRVSDILFTSIYVPNGGKDYAAKTRFLGALEAYAAEAQAQNTKLLICGDLNVARQEQDVHPKLRKPTQIGQTPEERDQFERILSYGLVDLSRKFHPDDDRLFTWWAPWRNMRERNIGWRLDYVLASEPLAAQAVSCESTREFGTSDHAPVLARFDIEIPSDDHVEPDSQPRGRGQLSLFTS